ncbi:ornithine cyclodeaminase family protein [Haloferula sp. A504]|uniref:ornithine cyclodeaminase family protein n=1 Tax=Haloferula sp. A504 TaxID=3373601 RepID=UPI0031BEEE1F|nr:ornithine cyclodeaminase family protein [Verrucomicrobiaceae bacterium E54]
MSIRMIAGSEVAELLPMDRAIELTREGFRALAEGRTEMPVRQKVEMADGDMLLKPCCLPGRGMTVKLVTTCAGNPDKGLPLVQGIVLVFDDVTGTPRAVIDAGQLTSIRTGAGGGLAADLLACPDSCAVALIGAGVQARQQLLAAMTVRNIKYVTVFDPSDEAVEILKSEFGAMPDPPVITRTRQSDEGVADADIVITATTSPVPTFHGSVLRPGTHVNAIGAYRPDRRELDEDTMRRSYVVVDGMAAAGREAGEVLIPGITPDAELGELVTGAKSGRTSQDEITVFKSVGMAIQDAVSACYVLEEAERLNVGREVTLADVPVGPCLSNGLEFEAYMPEI